MLSSSMLLLNLIPLIDVTFSTPTDVHTNHPGRNTAGSSQLLFPFTLALEQRTCSLAPLRLFVFLAGRNWHSRERRARDLTTVRNTLPKTLKWPFGNASR